MSEMKNVPETPMFEEEQVVVQEEIVEEPEVTVHEEVPSPKQESNIVTGIVTGCAKLNVREHPDLKADALCILSASSEVKVVEDEVFDKWYHVFTDAGVEGFCMKRYISIKS